MKIATIGTSMITDTFIAAVKDVPEVTVAAVYSRTKESAQKFAEKHEVDTFYTSLEEIANDPSIDCVYIASPNSLHVTQAIYFLENNKHVICEKPIFSNVAEWKKAFAVAEAQGVYLFEAMRNVHMPNYLTLREKLDEVGKKTHATLSYAKYSSRYGAVLAGETPNIFSLDYSGGALVDLGVYPLTVAVGLFGKPKASHYYPVKIATGVDGSGSLVLTYDNFVCNVLVSKHSTSLQKSEIQGEDGTFVIDDMGALSEVFFHSVHEEASERIGEVHGKQDMSYEIAAFYEIISTGDKQAYEDLKSLSYDVLEIMEKVRLENGIVYKADK